MREQDQLRESGLLQWQWFEAGVALATSVGCLYIISHNSSHAIDRPFWLTLTTVLIAELIYIY